MRNKFLRNMVFPGAICSDGRKMDVNENKVAEDQQMDRWS